MKDDIGKSVSLIPIENDDNFYNIYHHNTPSNQKLNILLKRSYDSDKINLFNEQNKHESNLLKFRKKQIPKLNLRLQREYKLPSLITRIPHSGKKNGKKLNKMEKIDKKEKYLTINNIVLDENDIIKKKAINQNIPMKRYIILSKKNLINKNIINKKYERDMLEFKIYSHNMNDMIAEQMVKEFFKRINKLKSLNFNDLLLNYILSCDGKNNLSERRFSTINNTINNSGIEEQNINENEEPEHNLIIHNVFFEWIISKVIKNYTNNLKFSQRGISARKIKNIFINEVKNLSKLFFHKKYEKINFIRNIDNLNKNNDDSFNSKEEGNSNISLEIKKMKIKNELIDNIAGKFSNNDSNSDSLVNSDRFNNYPKSVSIRRKKQRDIKIKINLKKNINQQQKDIKTILNDTPDLSIKSEKGNADNTESNNIKQNNQQIPIHNHNNMSRNKNDINPKISVETNTDSTLVEKYKNLIGLKDIIEEVENPQLRLYDQYYKYERHDQLDDEKITFISKRRVKRKLETNIQSNRNENNSELLKYDINNSNNKRSNKKMFTENQKNVYRE